MQNKHTQTQTFLFQKGHLFKITKWSEEQKPFQYRIKPEMHQNTQNNMF